MTRREVLKKFRSSLPTMHSATRKGIVDALIAVGVLKITRVKSKRK